MEIYFSTQLFFLSIFAIAISIGINLIWKVRTIFFRFVITLLVLLIVHFMVLNFYKDSFRILNNLFLMFIIVAFLGFVIAAIDDWKDRKKKQT